MTTFYPFRAIPDYLMLRSPVGSSGTVGRRHPIYNIGLAFATQGRNGAFTNVTTNLFNRLNFSCVG